MKSYVYSFDPKTGETVRLLEQIGVSNGIVFSGDGKTLCMSDALTYQ